MNILERFNKENFENCFSLLFEDFDSYKIVDGNICFFKNEPCDICQANTEGANAIHFAWDGVVDNPYTLGDVDDVKSHIGLEVQQSRSWMKEETRKAFVFRMYKSYIERL